MPVYFGPVAPTCPISSDQIQPPRDGALPSHLLGRPVFVRPAVPQATDLPSALNTLNLTRNIVQSITMSKIVNNTIDNKLILQFGAPTLTSISVAPDKYKQKTARWVEQTNKRVKRFYKYYGKDANGNKDEDVWVIMERIEQMVWYDRAWKSYLVWTYGNKGEGEPTIQQVGIPTG